MRSGVVRLDGAKTLRPSLSPSSPHPYTLNLDSLLLELIAACLAGRQLRKWIRSVFSAALFFSCCCQKLATCGLRVARHRLKHKLNVWRDEGNQTCPSYLRKSDYI